jgi:predicted esterase
MKLAVDRVHKLIQGELDKGIDADRIVLAGFSQGVFGFVGRGN